MKYLLILILFFSFSVQSKIYLKLDGQNIVGHDYQLTAEHIVEIDDIKLADKDGNYKFKYNNGLVPLSEAEMALHPLKVLRNTEEGEISAMKTKLKEIKVKIKDKIALTSEEVATVLKFVLKKVK